ncbi:helix-turn-helix domain-containing protein [Pseudarthrobacter phenanthrenivorans]|uniref:helix-turn-helix domain-containing protein n=1 Tax=Pseudarthrobacter phenanthrenivorans TaxID=361575 RepID=UPI0012E06119
MESEEAQVPSDRLLTVSDLAKLLQMSPEGVRGLMKKERWPHSKYGSRIRFEQSDVDAIRAMHRADVSLKARPTNIGTKQSRRRSENFNRRNGLTWPSTD